MYTKIKSPDGDLLEVFFDWPELTNIRVFWPRKWYQLTRRPCEDARLIVWCSTYLHIKSRLKLL